MKKVILIVASIFTLTMAHAQDAKLAKREMPNPEAQATSQVERLNQLVTLTDAQKPKVMEFTLAKIKASNEMRQKPRVEGENPTQKRDAMQKINADYLSNLKTVLTPEQYLKVSDKPLKTNVKEGEAAPKATEKH